MESKTILEDENDDSGAEEEEEEESVYHMQSPSSSSSTSSSGAAATPRGEIVHEPRPMDVICGRGSRITHPGNQRFRKLVAENKSTYQRATRREDKTKITLDIVQKLMRCEDPSRYVCFSRKLESCSTSDTTWLKR